MTIEQTEFFKACEFCAKVAAEEGKKHFVRRRGDHFVVSGDISKDWLFTAFPGGRKVLSVAGREIVGL
jgi:hypothetical protein